MPRTRTKSYPGSITRRGASWRVRLCVGGDYQSFTIEGTRTEAENFAVTRHKELANDLKRSQAGLPGPITFSGLVAEFTKYELPPKAQKGAPCLPTSGVRLSVGTGISYRGSFKFFEAYFKGQLGDPMVRDIRRGHIKGFLEWRGAHAISAHTLRRDLRVLHLLFGYAQDREFVDANPCERVKGPKVEERTYVILDADQFERLLEKAAQSPMLHLYLLLLAETGTRVYSEALQLTWADVDLAGGFLHVRSAPGRRTKNGKSRHVPITTRLREALRDHAARYRFTSPYVFHHATSHRNAKAGERIRDMRNSISKAAKAAELPAGFRIHDLRHRRITTWLVAGGNPVHVKEAVGHADLATTMRYTHLKPEHLLSLVEPVKPARAG